MLILFFFQAEDGIRDIGVTGVQTCALPIYGLAPPQRFGCRELLIGPVEDALQHRLVDGHRRRPPRIRCLLHLSRRDRERSEERRVGEEGRSRWTPYH